jgi:hypothetical protein
MNNKFLREARELTKLFCLEYEVDPDLARSNLEERLDGKRQRIREMTKELIKNKISGGLNG